MNTHLSQQGRVEFPITYGKYELISHIATGGMADVFLARSFGLAGFEKHLVIKRLRAELEPDPHFIQLFVNEAKIGVHLSHPNIVQVYDLGQVGRSTYIAMEYLRGHNLTQWVRALRAKGETLPPALAVSITARICRGLAYAHSRTDESGDLLGLVHRDVSPHNIVVTFDGEVKLVDFGVARLVNTQSGRRHETTEGRPGGGKYAYMSPEQASGLPIDHRSDLFSTGILLWELLTGRRLFQDPDPDVKLKRVREAQIPHPSAFNVPIDDALWTLLKTALARAPEDRFSSASLFEEELKTWLFRNEAHTGRAQIAVQIRAAFADEDFGLPPRLELMSFVEDFKPRPPLTKPVSTPGEAERRRVVIAAIDIEGLIALSLRLDPRALFFRKFRLLRWLTTLIRPFHGELYEVQEHQILVLFGGSQTQAEDPVRAVQFALALQSKTEHLATLGIPQQIGVGLHLGEVFVNQGKRRKLGPRGDTFSLVRILASLAQFQQVLVSERLRKHIEGRFRLQAGPVIPARGKRVEEHAFSVMPGSIHSRTRGQHHWSPRGPEVQAVQDAMVALSRREGALVPIIGDYGSGKSRLLSELKDLAERRAFPFFLIRCAPYGENPPSAIFSSLLQEILSIDPNTHLHEREERLQGLAQLGLNRDQLNALRGLIGLSKRRTQLQAVRDAFSVMLKSLAKRSPLILAVEDLHFLTSDEQHTLLRLLRWCAKQSILVLVTSLSPASEALSALKTIIELGPLSAANQAQLIGHLLNVDEVEPTLLAFFARTCDGNPLYIEEMVHYLLQAKWIGALNGHARWLQDHPAPKIPDSLTGLIAARIDAIDPGARGALQLAAVIGNTFSATLLARAAGLDDPTPQLGELVGHGLIQRSTDGPVLWSFCSELVRRIATKTLLGFQKRAQHRVVAEAIESLYPDQIDEHAHALAQHWAKGEVFSEASRYAHKAGQLFEKAHYFDRSLAIYEAGLGWANAIPNTPENWDLREQAIATLHFRSGSVALILGQLDAGLRHLQLALDITADSRLPWIEVRVQLALGRCHLERGNLLIASAHLDQARQLSRSEDDDALGFDVLEATAALSFESGHYEEAEAQWREALTLAGPDAKARARCLIGLSNRHLKLGHSDKARETLQAALHESRRAKDRIIEGRALNNLGLVYSSLGEYNAAIERFREAMEVRRGLGYQRGVIVNQHNIGDAYFHLGQFDRAYAAFSQSHEMALELSWNRGATLNELFMGFIEAQTQQRESGIGRLQRAIRSAKHTEDAELVCTGLYFLGRIELDTGALDNAKRCFNEALQSAESAKLKPMIQRLTMSLSQIADSTGSTR